MLLVYVFSLIVKRYNDSGKPVDFQNLDYVFRGDVVLCCYFDTAHTHTHTLNDFTSGKLDVD